MENYCGGICGLQKQVDLYFEMAKRENGEGSDKVAAIIVTS